MSKGSRSDRIQVVRQANRIQPIAAGESFFADTFQGTRELDGTQSRTAVKGARADFLDTLGDDDALEVFEVPKGFRTNYIEAGESIRVGIAELLFGGLQTTKFGLEPFFNVFARQDFGLLTILTGHGKTSFTTGNVQTGYNVFFYYIIDSLKNQELEVSGGVLGGLGVSFRGFKEEIIQSCFQ